MSQFIHCRGEMGWTASPYSSLSCPWLPRTSNIFVSRSHQQLTQPLFGGLTVQVHLQPWLFSLWLSVSSSARQSTSCVPAPAHRWSTATPPAFRHTQSTTGAHCIRGLAINQLVSPSAGKKFSDTWKLWESLFLSWKWNTKPSHYLLIFSAYI